MSASNVTESNMVLSITEQERNRNVEQIAECADLIKELRSNNSMASGTLTAAELREIYKLEQSLEFLLDFGVYNLDGCTNQIAKVAEALNKIHYKQCCRLATVAANAAMHNLVNCEQRLEKLLELQRQVLGLYTKISQGYFLRLIKYINTALSERYYEFDSFTAVFNHISAQIACSRSLHSAHIGTDQISNQLIASSRRLARQARDRLDTSILAADELIRHQNQVLDVDWRLHKPNLTTFNHSNTALSRHHYINRI